MILHKLRLDKHSSISLSNNIHLLLQLGSCNGITVLSLRSNKLEYLPDEIGRIPRLRVLNLSDNRLNYLPFSITRLKELQALWLSENQVTICNAVIF